MNRFMKPSRIFSHAGIPHAAYEDLEFYVEIMCALANMRADDPPFIAPTSKSGYLSSPHVQLRLAFFRSLYVLAHPPTNLLHLNPPPSELCAPASPSLEQLWRQILSVFPDDMDSLGAALTARAAQTLADVRYSEYFPSEINYSHAQWTHKYPDHRATALHLSHYVLLIEICMRSYKDGRFGYFIQGTVHPSQRSTRRHFPRIAFNALPPPRPFALHSAVCSCEDGCVRVRHCPLLTSATVLTASARTCKHSCSLCTTRSSLASTRYIPLASLLFRTHR